MMPLVDGIISSARLGERMQFPVYFNVAGCRVHAHLAMELIAYSGGFQIYLWLRKRWKRASQLTFEQNMWILVGCVFGALAGSKLLAWAESWPEYWAHRDDPMALLGGKTIVGGLLGGWIGVEIAKRKLAIQHSTGDLFVFPLIFGMAVGRVGCFLTGLSDHTYGTPTTLPWGVDFGDHVSRHPTQIYEILFLVAWGLILARCFNVTRASNSCELPGTTSAPGTGKMPASQGSLFRLFMLGYLAMRFAIEFIKPSWKPYLGLSAIQLACAGGMIACSYSFTQINRRANFGSVYEQHAA